MYVPCPPDRPGETRSVGRLYEALSSTHEFRRKIEALIEEERRKPTGTPDFILAAYLQKCLERFPQEGVTGGEIVENWTRIFGEAP